MSNRRPNAEVFLRALQTGRKVEYRNTCYQLIKAGDDIVALSGIYESKYDVLVTIAKLQRGAQVSTVMLPCDITYNDIQAMCSDMTEDERIALISSSVLQSMIPVRKGPNG